MNILLRTTCLKLLFTLITPLLGFSAAAETVSSHKSATPTECTCPREGRWKVQNLEGWMNCTGPIDLRRTLKEVKDKGTVWVLETDCSSLFGEASRKRDEDILLYAAEDCGFEGTINGEEDGVQMVIDVSWKIENNEFITGEMHSAPSFQGMACEYFRPYEMRFDQEIPAGEYPKLKKKMEKKLKQARARDGR